MIRINLLKPLQQQAPAFVLHEPGGGRRKAVLILAGLLIVAGAVVFLQYPTLFSGLIGSKQSPVTAQPEPGAPAAPAPAPGSQTAPQPEIPVAQPKRVTAQAVEEIVNEIQADLGRNAPGATYADLVPSEKVEFQYFACARILKDIKAVTPLGVGFANFIFTPPGDFYVHGLAYDEEAYERFKQGLDRLEGATVRVGKTAKAGARGTAREFSFFGTVKYPITAAAEPPDHVVSQATVQTELKQLQNAAGTLGIKLRNPKLMTTTPAAPGGGRYRTMVFQAAADCNYQQMEALLSHLQENKSNLGVLKFRLRASGDERVTADLDIAAYVN